MTVIEEVIDEAFNVLESCRKHDESLSLGAAVLTESNKIFSSCNIINDTFSMSAEKAAVIRAMGSGETAVKVRCVNSFS